MIKAIYKIFIFSFIFAFFSSCQEEKAIEPDITLQYPVAAFTFTGNDGPPPVTVQFFNKCETIYPDSAQYTWTFGTDGPQSNLKDPSFTFNNPSSQPRIYMVTLEVKDLASNLSQARSLGVEIQGSGK